MPLRYATLALVLSTTFVVAVACGVNRDTSGPQATATISSGSPPTSGPAATSASSSESGKEPIFWRTADNFQSLQAGKPYKALFRITNGYVEPALNVVATCESCPQASDRTPIEFQAKRTEPVGREAPGSYYPLNITLPSVGRWEIDVVAGNDRAKILVDAQPG